MLSTARQILLIKFHLWYLSICRAGN